MTPGVKVQRGAANRINPQGHPVGLINDNNFVTAWISEPDVPEVNLTVNLVEGSNSLYEVWPDNQTVKVVVALFFIYFTDMLEVD